MSYHRYGRHGPNAWKRWRQHRNQQRLPALIPTTAIVLVQAPANAERIIFIVVNPPESLDPNEPIVIQTEPQSLPPQPVVDNSPLARGARIRAVDDIAEIKSLIETRGPVIILDEDVHKHAMLLAKEEVKKSYSRENTPDPAEYKLLVDRWARAYLGQFEEERKVIARGLKQFPDVKAVNLARKARQDRAKYSFPQTSRGGSHQRDLAVISALHEIDLCINLEDQLARVHQYVDIYDDAFHDPKEVVTWPGPDSFRH